MPPGRERKTAHGTVREVLKMKQRTEPYAPRERKTKTAGEALSALMRYAARAERSSGDALRLMHRWGVPEPERAAVLERLVSAGFIDDARFAAAYVREKAAFAGWGVHKIRAGLRAKGISAETAERAIAREYAAEELNGRLEELLARKLRSLSGGTKYEVKGKLVRFGLSRGYDYDAVLEAASRLVAGLRSDGDDDE